MRSHRRPTADFGAAIVHCVSSLIVLVSVTANAAEENAGRAPQPDGVSFSKPTNSVPIEPNPPSAPQNRPRTLAAARDVNVQFRAATNALAAGDAALVDVIQHRWFHLLAGSQLSLRGKVVLQFGLHQDGHVTNMSVLQTEVSEYFTRLCQAAVLTTSPLGKWSPSVRRAVGADERPVTITFRYLEDDSVAPIWFLREPNSHLICELRYRPNVRVGCNPQSPPKDYWPFLPYQSTYPLDYAPRQARTENMEKFLRHEFSSSVSQKCK